MKAGLRKVEVEESMPATLPAVADDRVQRSVVDLAKACERLMALPAFASDLSVDDERAVRTARAALASGADVSLRMGCRVLLRSQVLSSASLTADDLVVVGEAQRAVTQYQQMSLRLLDALTIHDDVNALDDALSRQSTSSAEVILGRYAGVLELGEPLSLSNLALLTELADERRRSALTHAESADADLVDACRGFGGAGMDWLLMPRLDRRISLTGDESVGDFHVHVALLLDHEFPELEPVVLAGDLAGEAAVATKRSLRALLAGRLVACYVAPLASGRHLIRVDAVDGMGGDAHAAMLQINTGVGRGRALEVSNFMTGYLEPLGAR